MVVAVLAVRMVQVAVDQVVDVITVGHRLVSAARAVPMAGLVATTTMLGCTGGRIAFGHRDGVLVDMIAVNMMKVPVVEVVDVAVVKHGGMSATWAVLMVVGGVVGLSAGRHHRAPGVEAGWGVIRTRPHGRSR